MTMGCHIDTKTVKLNALGLQSHALLESLFPGKKYLAGCADNAVPWESPRRGVKSPCDLARRAGISRGIGDVSIRSDFAAWNTANLRENVGEHGMRHGDESSK